MKYIVSLAFLLCYGFTGYTQNNRIAPYRPLHHKQVINNLLQVQSRTAPLQKTTAGVSTERVIAQRTKDNVLNTLTDSINLKYGINRGSFYDYNDMIYAYNYPYNTSPMFNYAGVFIKPQVYFDTLRHWTVNPNTLIYGYYETDMAGYDANQNITSYKERFNDSAIYPNRNFINSYNSAHNIDNGYWFNFHSGVSDSAFKQFFSYNSSNLLTKDSIYEYHGGSWHLVSRTLYTYNTSNDLILIDNFSNLTDTTYTLPFIEQIQYTNTYDVSHRLLSVATSYYNGTSFGPYVRDTFAYTGTYSYHTSWKQYQYDPINLYWAPMFNMSKIVNMSTGLPDTINIQGFDSLMNAWVPQTRNVMHYNAAHNPDTLKDYEYNFTSFPATPNFTTIYYYQTYLISADTKPVKTAPANVLIFPNPANNQLTISGLGLPVGTGIFITLSNTLGQMIFREGFTWQSQKQLSVKDLAPGTYFISIHNDKGQDVHHQSIIKN